MSREEEEEVRALALSWTHMGDVDGLEEDGAVIGSFDEDPDGMM